MLRVSMNDLLVLMECGIMAIEKKDGTPSTLIKLSECPQDHVLKAMGGKAYLVTGREGVDLTLSEMAADG